MLLLLGRKAMTNVYSMLKSRDITLPTKVHLVKAMVFPVVMYGCESLTIKKAENWRINAFEPWCWRRLWRVPWSARRSNQSILKEINPEYSLEGLMLKLKLQYFGHLMWRVDSLEKTLMLGKIEGRGEGDDRGWDGWIASLTRLWWTGNPWGRKEWATELNWTESCQSVKSFDENWKCSAPNFQSHSLIFRLPKMDKMLPVGIFLFQVNVSLHLVSIQLLKQVASNALFGINLGGKQPNQWWRKHFTVFYLDVKFQVTNIYQCYISNQRVNKFSNFKIDGITRTLGYLICYIYIYIYMYI